jgi:cyclic pyranopterin phosphate synthase
MVSLRPLVRVPTYLRVELTERCPLRCEFCHAEGNRPGQVELERERVLACIGALVGAGVRKVKLLGGEPLSRRDLPEIVAGIRGLGEAHGVTLDISMITSGVGLPDRLAAAFAAGLDRANMSIHGFSLEAFAERGGNARMLALRQKNLDALLAGSRPLKLNYVYRGARDDADLDALLAFSAGRPLVVGVLDELSDPHGSPATVEAAVTRLRGRTTERLLVADPHSLPTTELRFADGLRVEIKTSQLGVVAPWRECDACPARARCKEGIFAVRLTPDGWLQPCMDRPDWRFPLAGWVAANDGVAISRALAEAVA